VPFLPDTLVPAGSHLGRKMLELFYTDHGKSNAAGNQMGNQMQIPCSRGIVVIIAGTIVPSCFFSGVQIYFPYKKFHDF
jgi:hypothetical protein